MEIFLNDPRRLDSLVILKISYVDFIDLLHKLSIQEYSSGPTNTINRCIHSRKDKDRIFFTKNTVKNNWISVTGLLGSFNDVYNVSNFSIKERC